MKKETIKRIKKELEKGFKEPNSKSQADSIKKAIDLILLKGDSRTEFLIFARDFILDYISK